MGKDETDLIRRLNEALADEYAQYIEMATQASIVTGENSLYLRTFFESQGDGALKHAARLRERIFFLGGHPTTAVGKITIYHNLQELFESAVEQHRGFVKRYRDLLQTMNRKDGDVLYENIEDILYDEQADLEAFRRLAGKLD